MSSGDVILSRDGEDWVVTLNPPDPSGLHETERRFSDLRDARGTMGGMRLVLGRRKVDETGEL